MKRLIANVCGDIIGVGYSAIVATLAGTLAIKGYIEILSDGRAFIIAEGERADLERFIRAICIDNERIRVKKILADFREPTGEFQNFQDISPKKDEKQEPQTRAPTAEACHNALAPDRMQTPERELCRPHNDFSDIGPDLEPPDKSIEAIGDERPAAESSRLQPERVEKLSLNK